MTLDDEVDRIFRANIDFIDGGCCVVLYGELDWTKDSKLITKCFDEAWSNDGISFLKIDCRDLFFIHNEEVLGAYFVALIISLKEMAKKRHVKLLIHLRSKRQAAILNLWGKKMWRKFKRHLTFDNPD